jgi:hypothetical protein
MRAYIVICRNGDTKVPLSMRGTVSFCHCEAGEASRSNLVKGKGIAPHFFREVLGK